MLNVTVKRIAGKYRIVDESSGRIANTDANNKPRDGGGHRSKAKAVRQASYINQAGRGGEK